MRVGFRMRSLLVSALLLCSAGPVLSYNPLTNDNAAQKFNFLPVTSASLWGPLIRGPDAECADAYEYYLAAWEAKDWRRAADGAYNTSKCILTEADEMRKKTMDSAAVLLGLAPILFSTIGPSLSELGLISLQRPLLAVLFSLGTVGIFPSRVLSYYDDSAKEILERQGKLDKGFSDWLIWKDRRRGTKRPQFRLWCFFVGVLEYVICGVAVFNVIYTSWKLGTASIYVADSPASFYPMIWTLLPLIIHVFAASAMHVNRYVRRHRIQRRRERESLAQPLATPASGPGYRGDTVTSLGIHHVSKTSASTGLMSDLQSQGYKEESAGQGRGRVVVVGRWQRLVGWAKLQFLPSAAHPPMAPEVVEASRATMLIHNFATGLGFAQVVFGTIIFSSLLFVAPADAAVVLLRYIASVFACRLMIAFELGGMRLEGQE